MPVSRRQFVQHSTVATLGFMGLRSLAASLSPRGLFNRAQSPGFGPLLDDPRGVLALPAGFSYHVFSKAGEQMDDGLFVPALHDGMAAFPGREGTTILVRNHEVEFPLPRHGPFGWTNERLNAVDRTCLFDDGYGDTPSLGGTTTLVYDTRTRTLRRHFLSLAGTVRNCAGGPTPWNSWITCEESDQRVDPTHRRDHGYAFEVPASDEIRITPARPLKAMGRFRREAVAIDPRTSIVYQTEDQFESLLYRYIPDRPGDLAAGGRLQALVVHGNPGMDTRNWPDDEGTLPPSSLRPGDEVEVRWIDLDEIDAPENDLRFRGRAEGAACFARGEGIWFGGGALYIACTNGGPRQKGQVWRYTPGPAEGTPREAEQPGRLALFIESGDAELLENCDNLTWAPWGDLLMCEDSPGPDRVIGVTPSGSYYEIARNMISESELAGICVSPDETTLFVNIQEQGLTIAVTGPWASRQE